MSNYEDITGKEKFYGGINLAAEFEVELGSSEVALPEAKSTGWESKEYKDWASEDYEDFEHFLYRGDRRTVQHTISEITELLSGDEESKKLVPEGFPSNITPELAAYIEKYYMTGIDAYGNSVLEMKLPDEVTSEDLNLVKSAQNLGSSTSNSLVVGTVVFENTLAWSRIASRIERIQDAQQKAAVYRGLRTFTVTRLMPELNEEDVKRTIVATSGTHLWYLLSQGITYMQTEGGSTVGEAMSGVLQEGDVLETVTSIKPSRSVKQLPVRYNTGEPLKYEDYAKMHYDQFISAMSEALKDDSAEAFTYGFVIPGKGGVLYKEMPNFLKSLNISELAKNENLSEAQQKVVNNFIEKGKTFEIVLDCAQHRWFNPETALGLLKEANLEGWVMSTTSKSSEGAPFGGFAVATEKAYSRMKQNMEHGSAYDKNLLKHYYKVGFVPNDMEGLLYSEEDTLDEQSYDVSVLTRMAGATETFRDISLNKSGERMRANDGVLLLNSMVQERLRKLEKDTGNSSIRVQEINAGTDYLPSSIISFNVLKNIDTQEYFSSTDLKRLRMLMRLGVDVNESGEITYDNPTVLVPNPFGEEIVAVVDENNNVTVAKQKHKAYGRLAFNSTTISGATALIQDLAQMHTDASTIRRLSTLEDSLTASVDRIVRMVDSWDKLEAEFYKKTNQSPSTQ